MKDLIKTISASELDENERHELNNLYASNIMRNNSMRSSSSQDIDVFQQCLVVLLEYIKLGLTLYTKYKDQPKNIEEDSNIMIETLKIIFPNDDIFMILKKLLNGDIPTIKKFISHNIGIQLAKDIFTTQYREDVNYILYSIDMYDMDLIKTEDYNNHDLLYIKIKPTITRDNNEYPADIFAPLIVELAKFTSYTNNYKLLKKIFRMKYESERNKVIKNDSSNKTISCSSIPLCKTKFTYSHFTFKKCRRIWIEENTHVGSFVYIDMYNDSGEKTSTGEKWIDEIIPSTVLSEEDFARFTTKYPDLNPEGRYLYCKILNIVFDFNYTFHYVESFSGKQHDLLKEFPDLDRAYFDEVLKRKNKQKRWNTEVEKKRRENLNKLINNDELIDTLNSIVEEANEVLPFYKIEPYINALGE